MRSTRVLVLPFTVILSAALVFTACGDDDRTETAESSEVTAVL